MSSPLSLPPLRVSENRRFLIFRNGTPFFWFGDTGWELFHRLTREEAAYYLEKRKEQRFSLIQSVVLAEFKGVRQPNAYGDCALIGTDPKRPNEAYFRHVDWIVEQANSLGLFIGMLPTCSREYSVSTEGLSGRRLQLWWFNPRDGSHIDLGNFDKLPSIEVIPPSLGEDIDSVLVIDDASQRFPPPGSGLPGLRQDLGRDYPAIRGGKALAPSHFGFGLHPPNSSCSPPGIGAPAGEGGESPGDSTHQDCQSEPD